MLVDRVETFKAYRDTLRRRFDQATHAALEEVPPGEWDGMQVIRRKELERVIADFAAADPEPLPTSSEVRTPARIFVDAVCPQCGIPARVLVEIHTVLEVSDDGRSIKAKASSKSSSHVCGQLPLEVSEDSDQMALSDLVGPTQPTIVPRFGVSKPDDVSVGTPADDKCGAEASLDDPEDPGETIELVCERKVDHDALEDEDGRDHWSEGGFAWHFEERPVPLGQTNETVAEADGEDQEDDDATE